MRDPELVTRAQRAATRLESAWEQWRALHGLAVAPGQPVVSYVGYSLKEPWGEPRVVIGIVGPLQQVKLAEPPPEGTDEYPSSALLGAPIGHGRGRQSPDQARIWPPNWPAGPQVSCPAR